MAKAKANKVYVKSDEIVIALRERFCLPEWSIFFEVRDATGFAGEGRSADAVAMNCYPSRGLELVGFEIKVSRNDWLSELRNPGKSVAVQKYCDRWYVVAPEGVVQNGERPITWGEFQFQRPNKLRMVAEAPKLEAVPLSKTFIAAILRNACNVGHMEIRKAVNAEIERERASMEKTIEDERRHRGGRATEALAKVEEIKQATGIDLAHWTPTAEIAAAIRFALDAHLHGYNGLKGIREQAVELVAKIDEAASKNGVSEQLA